jgi:drug/metabolite transporter (DMT)-like permease
MAESYPQLSILPLVQLAQPAHDGDMRSFPAPRIRRPVLSSAALSWLALGVVYLVWGSTYLAIRVGVGHLPPLFMAGTRYLTAGALLYPVARRAAGRNRPPGPRPAQAGPPPARPGPRPARANLSPARPGLRAWLAGAVVGLLLLVAGNGGLTVGETTLPSGFAAVLVATVPLWMIVFARLLQHQRITLKSALALAVGLGGVAVLVGAGAAPGDTVGVIIVLGAAAAWGLGSVLSHQLALPSHAMLAAAIEMLVGGVVLLAIAAGAGEFSHVAWSAIPPSSWAALAYLIGPGSILAFTAYGYALSHLPAATVSTYAYVNPVVAVLAGIVFIGEQFTWREGLGAALVVGSIVITLHRAHGALPPADVTRGSRPARRPGRAAGPLEELPDDLPVPGPDPGPRGAGDAVVQLHEGGEEQRVLLGLEEQFARQPEAAAGAQERPVRSVVPDLPAEHEPV